jgi:hypothetical protein
MTGGSAAITGYQRRDPAMKKIAVVLLVAVVAIVAVVVVVFFMTGGIVDTADRFFTAAAAGDDQLARSELSAAFLADMSDAELAAFLDRIRQLGYVGASWHTRSIENDQGQLEGSIETDDGGKVPVMVTLVKEGDGWRILAVRLEAAGVVAAPAGPRVPDAAEQERLVDGSIQALAQAINSADFSGFHASVARLWQAQTTAAELRQAFASFVDQQIDLTVLSGMEPVFSAEPSLDADGVLHLVGYYPSQPAVTHFELDYVYEHPDWKLLGAGVELR